MHDQQHNTTTTTATKAQTNNNQNRPFPLDSCAACLPACLRAAQTSVPPSRSSSMYWNTMSHWSGDNPSKHTKGTHTDLLLLQRCRRTRNWTSANTRRGTAPSTPHRKTWCQGQHSSRPAGATFAAAEAVALPAPRSAPQARRFCASTSRGRSATRLLPAKSLRAIQSNATARQ